VFYYPFYQYKKCSQSNSHYEKIKEIHQYLQHICATCYRKEGKKMYHPECSEMCPLQRAWLGYIKAKSTCSEQT
jgi:hypothetical protein